MSLEDLIDLGYCFTEDKALMDIDIIHQFLSKESSWAQEIPRRVVQKSVENSMCFAILHNNKLVAFARVVTDKATFANLVDVFVLPDHRGKGLARWLTQEILAHAELQGLRRFTLTTSTASGLYEKFGFKPLTTPKVFMEIYVPDIYAK